MKAGSVTASEIGVGDVLPVLSIPITAQKIISAAAATRDWQPIHHDHELAIKSGLRGIILNAPSQTGWISKYITDWAGSQAQIKKLSFKMKDSVCPGDVMSLNGTVMAVDRHDSDDCSATVAVTVSVEISAGEKLKTSVTVQFTLPS
jgi:acyl dehydratase